MFKLIDSSSFFREDEVTVSLLHLQDITATSVGLEKRAADERITEYVSSVLTPKAGKFYLHINAMGAGEYYGSNKNADYFPEQQLLEFYKTFEETGYVYRHHINKDPAKSIGKVIFAIYNDRMRRVELIAELDRKLASDIYDRILAGEMPKTSMACRTPFDVCSICGNKAYNTQQYCEHLKETPNKILPDGRRVMALNLGPLRFFDISIVIKPADVTSSVLQKVAYQREPLSAELAQEAQLFDQELELVLTKSASKSLLKKAALHKVSELIKKIDSGEVMSILPIENAPLDDLEVADEEMLKVLSSVPVTKSFNALAEVGVVPSIEFLAELIAKRHVNQEMPDGILGKTVAKLVSSASASDLLNGADSILDDIEEEDADAFLAKYLRDRKHLLQLKGQVKTATDRYYDGYVDTSHPKTYYTAVDKAAAIESLHQEAKTNPSVLSFLLKVGGAALLAKIIISNLIDEKIDKLEKNRLKSHSMMKVAGLVCRSIVRTRTGAYTT